jgi:hypothetical protein
MRKKLRMLVDWVAGANACRNSLCTPLTDQPTNLDISEMIGIGTDGSLTGSYILVLFQEGTVGVCCHA